MTRKIFTGILLAFAVACHREEERRATDPGEIVATIPGKIRVKLTSAVADSVERADEQARTRVAGLEASGVSPRAYKIERVIPPHGKYNDRHRARGLHAWYDVSFDEKTSTRAAATAYASLPGVEHAEEIIAPARVDPSPFIVHDPGELPPATRAGLSPYDDPYFDRQWYLHNPGPSYASGALAGADVNALAAWTRASGSPAVIVAVIDKTAFQVSHPDLAANAWVNNAEIPGNGIDDDDNGYVDDLNGFDYTGARQVDGRYVPVPHDLDPHPTWCAGFISAVNNNATGISSIAGGARLMALSWEAQAFVYAADNGAAIASNSWMLDINITTGRWATMFAKTCIDYFIDNAGVDDRGEQAGPARGGLALFAAGNDGKDHQVFPAADERVIAVAAMGPDYRIASYSTRGDWVDVTAPGGSQDETFGEREGMLLGTYTNTYAWGYGTSGACPIAAGCAALILSKFQGEGFTADSLREKLLSSVKNIDDYNPGLEGKTGTGSVDASIALVIADASLPVAPLLGIAASHDDWAILEWETTGAASYILSWSTAPLAGNVPATSREIIPATTIPGNSIIRDTLQGLEPETRYYYTVHAVDRTGARSVPSNEVSAVTARNLPPSISPRWTGELIWDKDNIHAISCDVNDPEGTEVTVTIDPALSWINATITGNVLALQVDGRQQESRAYSILLTATDRYGASASFTLSFVLHDSDALPVLVAGLPDITLRTASAAFDVPLAGHFLLPSGEHLLYTVTSDVPGIAIAELDGDNLRLTPLQVGSTRITVTAANASIPVLVAAGHFALSITNKTLFSAIQDNDRVTIMMNEPATGPITIRLYNVAGQQVLSLLVTIPSTGYLLDLRALSPGVYSMILAHDAREEIKNIVKR
ncbi:MAG: S8 family serine peptidase [Odoribacteraceae bacterium]|jgi:hypothetical protein|nr:S8 family serine peptidase [Odoribacteraceae bacterium]